MFSNLDSAIGSDLKNTHFNVMLSDLIQDYYLKKKNSSKVNLWLIKEMHKIKELKLRKSKIGKEMM